MDQKIEIEIAANEDANMLIEEITLDVESEALNVTLGVNRQGNIEASGPADDVKQLVANPDFIERFFGGVSVKTVLDLIHDDSYEITGNRDRVAEARGAVRRAKASS
ncbi:MAG TPA: hypothetical protein VF595_12585 [Tepidisphaeraceae bacterium]|jgi:hypothetical protein